MSAGELFAWPAGLPLLLLVPLAWLLLRTWQGRRARRLLQLLGPRAPLLAAELSPGQRRLRRHLGVGGLLLALLALLQPRWGEGVQEIEQRGVDLLLCLDVSQSMLARDLAPSRLARAQREIRVLTERARGDRLGLVIFSGEARVQVPLTLDLDSLAELAELADTLAVSRGGTDLGAALEAALQALEGRRGDHEVVVLLTDGEDLEGRGQAVAAQCRQQGITVHCLGLGSRQGSKIPLEGKGREVFLRTSSGQEVVSALDAGGLARIAEITGGEYLEVARRPRPLLELYERRIQALARKSFEAEKERTRANRFQWPLLLAYLLWLAELSLSDRRWR